MTRACWPGTCRGESAAAGCAAGVTLATSSRRMPTCSHANATKDFIASSRLIYTMLTKGEEYTDQGQDYYEDNGAWNERPQIGQAVRFRTQYDNRERQLVGALLKCQIPIDGSTVTIPHIDPWLGAVTRRCAMPAQPSAITVVTSWPTISPASRQSTHSSSSTLTKPIRSDGPSRVRGRTQLVLG